VKLFCERLMGEEADAICGASYGERSEERINRRNGYRSRTWDTRTGTIDLAVPKLREGSYFPDWLLEPRRRAERAFVQVLRQSTHSNSIRGKASDPYTSVVKRRNTSNLDRVQIVGRA
jgi:putative transposase